MIPKDIQSIYEKIGDDVSKEIYMDRFSYSLAHDGKYLKRMADNERKNSIYL